MKENEVMPETIPVETEAGQDELIARVLAELTAPGGQAPAWEQLAQQYPSIIEEVRELWTAARLADRFIKSSNSAAPTVDGAAAGNKAGPAESIALLPRPFGEYELLEELGRGGMGVVYKARQRQPERLVAIKMLLRGDLSSPLDVARFRAEAQSVARLDGHPNIITVHEVNEVQGQPYFSMKYVEGTTLAKMIATGPLAGEQAARYVQTICQAVHYAHQRGVYHRDLKPSNVLIDTLGQPHVTDFGLAKRVEGGESLTQSGAIIGTPSYMPPEQAAGNQGTLSPASDVYSIGAILYELLTGRPPFQAASRLDTVLQVLYQDLVPPRLLNPKIDRDLEMICLKCLQKQPELRYASADLLAKDLEQFLQGNPVSARASGITTLLTQMFRDTHNAPVLENWGLLWMWHSLKILAICAVTLWMKWSGIESHWPYLVLWSIALLVWGWIFWTLRRRGGPVTFIERQIAHVWAAGVFGSISIFVAEWVQGLPVLSMAPGLAVVAGMVFLIKAGMLSGDFYYASAALFATGLLMTIFPSVQLILFALVSAACFFFPGIKYYRQRQRTIRPAR
jgi:serine/threonine-protein kinase